MSWMIEKQAFNVLPASQGATIAVNCTTVVQLVDLARIPQHPCAPPDNRNASSAIGKYVRIEADGGTVYYATGNNTTLLNTISPTSYTTVAANGLVTVTGNECFPIPAGSFEDFVATAGQTPQITAPMGSDSPARYVAVVATANANIIARIRQSSY